MAHLGRLWLALRRHSNGSVSIDQRKSEHTQSLTSHSIGVTTLDRPAAAPATGDFELGYHVIGNSTFVAGMTASAIIFVSSSGTSSFMPVVAEMRRPKDYNKALFTCMSILNASYLAFGLVVYRWCGAWVANPALGVSSNGGSHPEINN